MSSHKIDARARRAGEARRGVLRDLATALGILGWLVTLGLVLGVLGQMNGGAALAWLLAWTVATFVYVRRALDRRSRAVAEVVCLAELARLAESAAARVPEPDGVREGEPDHWAASI